MEARFRIRTPEGHELEPRSLEIFSEMVRSGVIRPRDQVFDALTGRWVAAGEHPMVRLFKDPLVLDPDPADEPLSLALAAPSGPSHEEAEAAFIRRMEEERRNDPERVPLALELPLFAGDSSAREHAPDAAGVRTDEGVRTDAGGSEPFPGMVVLAPPRRRARRSLLRWDAVALAGAASAFLALLVVVVSLRAPDSPAATLAAAPGAPAAAVRAEGEVREGARAGFLARVAGLRDEAGLGQVPAAWLEGWYLADAAARPEVRSYWEGVGAWIAGVERAEDEIYREAWLESAGGLGLAGPVRSLRLATALEDFAAGAQVRAEHYARVRELAAAAVALHDVLLELSGRVTYEPQRGRGVSADPVLEAAGTDPAAQALLEAALDRVLAALKGPGGDAPGERARMAAWMADIPF